MGVGGIGNKHNLFYAIFDVWFIWWSISIISRPYYTCVRLGETFHIQVYIKLDHRKVSKRKLINCRECQSCGAIEANANLRRHDQDLDGTVSTFNQWYPVIRHCIVGRISSNKIDFLSLDISIYIYNYFLWIFDCSYNSLPPMTNMYLLMILSKDFKKYSSIIIFTLWLFCYSDKHKIGHS